MQQVLVIAGMHRSGTSLTAMWLKGCGLFIGEKLMLGGFDNPLGHYEDLEILKIHEGDLKIKGLATNGLRLNNYHKFEFEENTMSQINTFLKSRIKYNLWGWKEPRSTLYLQAWKKITPGLRVLGVYRNCNDVIDSLVRRAHYSLFKSDKFKGFSKLAHKIAYPIYIRWEIANYIDAWIKYNNAILSFKEHYPNDIHIIAIESLISNSKQVFEKISEKWKLDLSYSSISEFYRSSLLNKTAAKCKIPQHYHASIKYINDRLENYNNQ